MGMSYLYSSTDTSAPALIDGVGYLVQVLDKVLVEGYGDKSGLGWTREYSSPDGKIVCYRNKGTGFFLRVNNSINYASTGMSAKMETFEVMSAWDTGYLRTPEEGVDHYFCYADTKTTARVIKWKVIGDDKGFWIITEHSTTANVFQVAYFGDYIPYYLEDVSNWISFTNRAVEVDFSLYYCPWDTVLTGQARIARNHQNKLPVRQIQLYSGFGRNSSYTFLGKEAYRDATNYTLAPVPIFAKPYLGFLNIDIAAGVTNLIGEIPGLLECCSWSPSGSVVQQSGNSSVHVFWLPNYPKIGILAGEGFRP